MMAITHAAISAAAAGFALTPNGWVIGLAIAGSQIPDVDTSKSWVGSVFFPVSRWIEARYPHRTVTHSLVLTAVLTGAAAIAGYTWPDQLGTGWPALPIGHAAACFADTFTKQGVQLFWPKPAWCVAGANPHRRLSTGSVGEYFVLAFAIALLLINLQFSTSGGWMRSASQAFGLREGALQVYNEEAAKRHVYANVKGYWVSDRSKADGRYWILGTDSGEFILSDGKGVYKTGENMIVEKLSASPGTAATTITRTISFNDQEPEPLLQQLQLDNQQSAIYLSGNLTIDFPEDLRQTAPLNQMQTLSLSGNQVYLKYASLERCLIQLSGQYVTGTITAKILTPRPL